MILSAFSAPLREKIFAGLRDAYLLHTASFSRLLHCGAKNSTQRRNGAKTQRFDRGMSGRGMGSRLNGFIPLPPMRLPIILFAPLRPGAFALNLCYSSVSRLQWHVNIREPK
jgi:hypothetical protein